MRTGIFILRLKSNTFSILLEYQFSFTVVVTHYNIQSPERHPYLVRLLQQHIILITYPLYIHFQTSGSVFSKKTTIWNLGLKHKFSVRAKRVV